MKNNITIINKIIIPAIYTIITFSVTFLLVIIFPIFIILESLSHETWIRFIIGIIGVIGIMTIFGGLLFLILLYHQLTWWYYYLFKGTKISYGEYISSKGF